jgi:hypothetical protein
MIPTRHDYYKRRAREHRALAGRAASAKDRAMHSTLVEAYLGLARQHGLRQRISVRADLTA